ncbi:class I SAM-dependent methyltransferase [Thioalkalicoccus limnaeus]|uniref:Class I SAM-dependent methyltransferase n=1 Tax=Thioalkalicoccus limnaeus TaxID=120681 RepID=A0ABV4BET9_9GAMM
MTEDSMRFGFGENWSRFVAAHLNEERIAEAQRHLLRFLGLADLRGRRFLDIGCGSGLHSLAALRAGAERVVSFDYDPNSVATTERVRALAGAPDHWTVTQGSVLDGAFMEALEPADIVYSWGVLHHTGDMWQAIELASRPLAADGVFYIALYCRDVYLDPPPEYWIALKQRYNRSGTIGRRLMEWSYAWRSTVWPELRSGRNPLVTIRRYSGDRGMAFWTDVRDWLGGYPMEFAGLAETQAFCHDRLGLELVNLYAGEGNAEYLFRRRGAANYWDEVRTHQTRIELPRPFRHRQGLAWEAPLPAFRDQADDLGHPRRSRLMLFEGDKPVGFAHQTHADIERRGGGRYSHWSDQLIFSTTDGTDPNANGRRYFVGPDGLP